MKANIILSQADFSHNNIGRYVELSELTEKVLTKQTQYSKSSLEALALEEFFSGLKAGGFIGGTSPLLKSLFIPALAYSHNELMFDILNTDENGYPINAMTASELNASESNKVYTVERNSNGNVIGIKRKYVTNSDNDPISTKMFDGYNVGNYIPSYSIVLYGLAGMTQNDTLRLIQEKKGWRSDIISNSITITSATSPYSNTNITAPVTRTGGCKGFNGFSLDLTIGEQGWSGIVNNGTIGDSIATGDYLNSIVLSSGQGVYAIGHPYNDDTRLARLGFLAFGKFLNATKMDELKVLVDTLMTALHAN